MCQCGSCSCGWGWSVLFCVALWATPVKQPWPPKVLKRTSWPGWVSNPATLCQRLRQSWRNSNRRTLTSGERLMKWPNGTSDRPAPTKPSCWRWATASLVCPTEDFFGLPSENVACLTAPCLLCNSGVPCDVGFRGFFPSRRCERETTNSCLLRSRNWKPWDSSWQPVEERYAFKYHQNYMLNNNTFALDHNV